MVDHRRFEQLLAEFKRVGVDPDTFSAVLAIRPEDALRALHELPDAAGPAAFLKALRELGVRPAGDIPSPAEGMPVVSAAPEPRRGDAGAARPNGDVPDAATRDRTGT